MAACSAAPVAEAPKPNVDLAKYRWMPAKYGEVRTALTAFPTLEGYTRVPVRTGSFAEWLRTIPLKEDGAKVMLHTGEPRFDQRGVAAIVDIDIGRENHQHCADFVIRLRSEYLFSRGQIQDLSFNFTNGTAYPFTDWLGGKRPVPDGEDVRWVNASVPAVADHRNLRQWLEYVFMYAGTWSLERELTPVYSVRNVKAGDVFIQGGFPGHAMTVIDVAKAPSGRVAVMLAQGFMPAQNLHIVYGPNGTVWHELDQNDEVLTANWLFKTADLKRFRTTVAEMRLENRSVASADEAAPADAEPQLVVQAEERFGAGS